MPTPVSHTHARRHQPTHEIGDRPSDELQAPDGIIGHERALESLRMGLAIRSRGYHVFAMGDHSTGLASMVHSTVGAFAKTQPAAPDTVLLHDFSNPRSPLAIRLPSGDGPKLSAAVDHALSRVAIAMPAAFQHDAFKTAQRTILMGEQALSAERFTAFQARARDVGVSVQRRDDTLLVAPLVDGRPIDGEELAKLDPERQEAIKSALTKVQEEMTALAADEQGRMEAVARAADQHKRRTAASGVRPAFDQLRDAWPQPAILGWLNMAETALVSAGPDLFSDGELQPWRVNVLVTHDPLGPAPVVSVDDPSWPALVGRVEHQPINGALTTHHGLVFAGALHQAHGGALIVEARRLLSHSGAWPGLKRALRQCVLRTEAPVPEPGVLATSSLEPAALPLDVNVILIGTHSEYRKLTGNDPDFALLFGIAAEFEDDLVWTPINACLLARRLADLARRDGLNPLTSTALAATIEHAARLADSQQRLSLHVEVLRRVIREADYVARSESAGLTDAHHIERAIAAQSHREGGAAERSLRGYLDGSVRVRTEGSAIGQVNGLAVLSTGRMRFGMASRISARVWAGAGHIVNVESESGLSGPFHDKGQFVIKGLLGGRYAQRAPLSLHANLVFEQSYAPVDGDSASMAELVALLSALAEVPVLQSRAMTGSVDQNGQAQAIGGVNDKIEGFFDLCRARGLTGEQGVCIPQANVADLMLRPDVEAAMAAGQFFVWPMNDVDDAFEVLTGQPAGQEDGHGGFAVDTPNWRIADRLNAFAQTAKGFRTS